MCSEIACYMQSMRFFFYNSVKIVRSGIKLFFFSLIILIQCSYNEKITKIKLNIKINLENMRNKVYSRFYFITTLVYCHDHNSY